MLQFVLSLLVGANFSMAKINEISGSAAETSAAEQLLTIKSLEDMASFGITQGPMSDIDNSADLEVQLSQAAVCQASTPCRYSPPIYCYTYGSGCTWQSIPYVGVSCTGYNGFGVWVNYTFYCP